MGTSEEPRNAREDRSTTLGRVFERTDCRAASKKRELKFIARVITQIPDPRKHFVFTTGDEGIGR